MPEYNTRLRTNAQILPPRRLRQNDSPIQPPAYHRAKPSLPQSPPPQFPLPKIQVYADDANNKTFLAIARALFAVENRAVTIKDLSYLVMKHGLVCQNASAASQAITTFIRNHLNRCRQDQLIPLLLSVPLTGTDADDRLAPALHSRSGGTSASVWPSDSALTNFRKGTTVWYLSEASGAVCPFKKAGLSIDDSSLRKGTKRKRDSQSSTQPKKIHTNSNSIDLSLSPASSSVCFSGYQESVQCSPRTGLISELPARSVSARRSSSPSDFELEFSPANTEDNDKSNNAIELLSKPCIPHADSLLAEDGSDDSDASDESESYTNDHDELQVFPFPSNELYPSSSPVSSSSNSVKCNDVYPFCFTQNLRSSHFIKSTWATFRTTPFQSCSPSKTKSISPSYFTPSPPPDSEDDDDDFHNSMVGFHRGKFSDKVEDNTNFPKFEPISPKFVPGSVHLARKTPEFEDLSENKPEPPVFESASIPLETLPGFVLEPEPTDSGVGIKEEPVITFTWSSDRWQSGYERLDHMKRDDVLLSSSSCSDPTSTDVSYDVEVLGPETVRSPEWDIAWNQFDNCAADQMDTSCCLPSQTRLGTDQAHPLVKYDPPIIPLPPSFSIFETAEISPSGVLIPTLSCNPAIYAIVVDDVSLYCTMLGPDMPFVRRIDNDSINITQVHRFLQIPPGWLLIDVPAPHSNISPATGVLQGTWVSLDVAKVIVKRLQDRIPADVINIFLSSDLGKHFPNSDKVTIGATMKSDDEECILNGTLFENEFSESIPKNICIQVEDFFELGESVDHAIMHQSRFKPEPRSSSSIGFNRLFLGTPIASNGTLGSGEHSIPSFDQQEEEPYRSPLDLDDSEISRNQHVLVTVEKRGPSAYSFSSNSTVPIDGLVSVKEERNSNSIVTVNMNKGRGGRKWPVQPVRRSIRVASKALSVTRLRPRAK
ncbi:hypothetical protein Clacol_006419 [Clathrus columnatus]|uniref:GDS1 winged helix domain-containing protein n=1 Tax=Clathrus columnatus TaxID=1419009 RepID=A0AAV5AHL4_9AGAM|nr:hypothetical protein Clacol_006419 [Clathrus columnatus]